MPIVSSFYGIKIYIYYDDHNEPHFHAFYSGSEGAIAISSGKLNEGMLPKNALKLINSWRKLHKKELLENWDLASEHKKLRKIDPLE